MKNLFFTLLAALLTCSFAQAQEANPFTPPQHPTWKVTSVGLQAGHQFDVYQRMNLHDMKQHAVNPEVLDQDLEGYEGNFYTRVDGAIISGNISLQPRRKKTGLGHPNQELRLGLAFNGGREAMIEYTKQTPMGGDTVMNSSIIYCGVQNELTASATYLYFARAGRRLSLYTGIGGNLGGTFSNDMLLIFSDNQTLRDPEPSQYSDYYFESLNEETRTFGAKSSVFTRVYIPVGMSVRFFKRMEVYGEARLGMGGQQIIGGDFQFIKHTGSTIGGLRYHFDSFALAKK